MTVCVLNNTGWREEWSTVTSIKYGIHKSSNQDLFYTKNIISGETRAEQSVKEFPLQKSEPVVGHVITFSGIGSPAGRQWRFTSVLGGRVQVGAVPGYGTGRGRSVFNDRRVECYENVLKKMSTSAGSLVCFLSPHSETFLLVVFSASCKAAR